MNRLNLILACLLVKVGFASEDFTTSKKPTKLMVAAKNGNIKDFLKALAKNKNSLLTLDAEGKNAIDYGIENNQSEKIKLALASIILLSQKK